jgi:ribose 5-phosphate isomerase B
MRIAIAADHNGLAMKAQLAAWLTDQGHEVDDRGTHGAETVDYPPLCADIGGLVAHGTVERGIVIGGTGSGEQIACNKITGVRAGLCHDLFVTEIARGHNDTNVLVMGAKVIAGPRRADHGALARDPLQGRPPPAPARPDRRPGARRAAGLSTDARPIRLIREGFPPSSIGSRTTYPACPMTEEEKRDLGRLPSPPPFISRAANPAYPDSRPRVREGGGNKSGRPGGAVPGGSPTPQHVTSAPNVSQVRCTRHVRR